MTTFVRYAFYVIGGLLALGLALYLIGGGVNRAATVATVAGSSAGSGLLWPGLIGTIILLAAAGFLMWKDKNWGLPLAAGIILGLLTFTQIGTNIVGNIESFTGGGSGSTLTVTAPVGGYSKPIRVTGDKCIFYWGEDPDGEAFTASVRLINGSEWYAWDERPGYAFAWIKFTSTSNRPALVSYEFRDDFDACH